MGIMGFKAKGFLREVYKGIIFCPTSPGGGFHFENQVDVFRYAFRR